MLKKLTALLLCAAMLTLCASCSSGKTEYKGINKNNKGAEDAVTAPEADETPVIWSDATTVTMSMFTYYFNSYYKVFLNENLSRLEGFGLDPSISLRDQYISEQSTWFQFILTSCYNEVKKTVSIADAAKENGFKLSSDDIDGIADAIGAYEQLAADAGKDCDTYLAENFGSNVNRATVEKCMRLRTLASSYLEAASDDKTPDESACEEYFESNKNSLTYYDCIRVVVPDEYVASLTCAEDDAAFTEAIREYITANNFEGMYDRFKDQIDSLAESKLAKRSSYNSHSEQSIWAFSEDRSPYDIYTEAVSTGNSAVVMILPAGEDEDRITDVLYRDSYPVKNFNYIVFEDETAAGEVYDKWISGGGTQKALDKLMKEYDGSTMYNVDRGDYSAEVNEWLFDISRKTGDSTVMEIDSAPACLICLLDDGDPSWIVDARAQMKTESTNNTLSLLCEKYPSEESDLLSLVEAVTVHMGN